MWFPVFLIQKPGFMLYHLPLGDGVSTMEWFQVMLHGLKLDLTVAGYLTVLPLLAVLLSFWLPGPWLRKILRGYYLIMAFLVAVIFVADLGLYSFWGFRLDSTVIFYLQSSFKDAMASVPIQESFFLIFIALIYTSSIYWLFSRLILSWTPIDWAKRPVWGTIGIILLGGLLFIAIRGGVTTSTANVGKVYFSRNQFLNHAAINPVFSLMTSLSKQQDFSSQFNFLPEEEREAIFTSLVHQTTGQEQKKTKLQLLNTDRPNILLVILESFTANAIESLGGTPGVTPHLNRLSKEGILFTQMYANSFRTDRGLVSILNSYPAQPTTSIMKYPAKSQTLPSLAKSLDKEGYISDVLYGGDINFTNMQSFFFSSGYSRITADRDFSLSTRLSKWGANDDITFNLLYQSMEERINASSPWLCTFLTLSSHEPFEVPFHHLEDPYLNSVAFTDSCIGSFIDQAKLLPIWDDLLVVFISDHGFRYPADLTEYEPGRYHIPMLWIGGAVKEPRIIDTYANQNDFVVTLLNQMKLPYQEFAFGKDIVNPSHPHYAFYTFNNGFGFIDHTGYSVFDNDGEIELLSSSPSTVENEERLKKGKAFLQTLYDDLQQR